MKIKEILAKVAQGDELSDDEKVYLEAYEEPNLDAAVNAKGKKERLKLEAKIAALTEALEGKDAEIEEANSGASEVEKLQKQLEKADVQRTMAQDALAKVQTDMSGVQRDFALKSVNIDWLPSVPEAYRKTVMTDMFKDIDTEDIADMNVITPIVASIKESQASFLTASTKSGAGVTATESASISDGSKITADNVGSLTGEALIKNMDAAWAVASQGE